MLVVRLRKSGGRSIPKQGACQYKASMEEKKIIHGQGNPRTELPVLNEM